MMKPTWPERRPTPGNHDRTIRHHDGCRSYILDGLNLTRGTALRYLAEQGFSPVEAESYLALLDHALHQPPAQNASG